MVAGWPRRKPWLRGVKDPHSSVKMQKSAHSRWPDRPGNTYCHDNGRFYTASVQLFWKSPLLILTAAFALVGAGCSGINHTQSVSPATFLLPGFFGQAEPTTPPTPAAEVSAPVEIVAR
jgi:hypothetical protein